ncbi:MAG: hypothetical protein LBP59_02355 [Planctomycetaceae bacterium]|jgi:hypothetical protein|nr:hypothetical protein [Planctomycetaceae bacterium]
MLPKNCGQLLFNAVRETLETMAFAEVVPCSIKVGGEEFSQADDDFSVGSVSVAVDKDGWGDSGGNVGGGNVGGGNNDVANGTNVNKTGGGTANDWGGVSSSGAAGQSADSWGKSDSWGSPDNGVSTSNPLPGGSFSSVNIAVGSGGGNSDGNSNLDSNNSGTAGITSGGWDDIDESPKSSGNEWAPVNMVAPSSDPWGDSEAVASAPAATMALKEADFDEMAKQFAPDEWCWACMKVNSPDIHSVWFIVTKGLANVLARNMYAGEEFQLDDQLIRDLIAELTNVLGGKLMLLLEEMGGKFTLTVPEIGFGLPELPDEGYENAVCKVVVDGEHPVIVALCFNPGGISATGNK